ncbi:MAG: hypothetical protein HY747_01190 [Elusimicrobia bacterium]|nr:hypothetical protein [Elusimicrobiota bacterium]
MTMESFAAAWQKKLAYASFILAIAFFSLFVNNHKNVSARTSGTLLTTLVAAQDHLEPDLYSDKVVTRHMTTYTLFDEILAMIVGMTGISWTALLLLGHVLFTAAIVHIGFRFSFLLFKDIGCALVTSVIVAFNRSVHYAAYGTLSSQMSPHLAGMALGLAVIWYCVTDRPWRGALCGATALMIHPPCGLGPLLIASLYALQQDRPAQRRILTAMIVGLACAMAVLASTAHFALLDGGSPGSLFTKSASTPLVTASLFKSVIFSPAYWPLFILIFFRLRSGWAADWERTLYFSIGGFMLLYFIWYAAIAITSWEGLLQLSLDRGLYCANIFFPVIAIGYLMHSPDFTKTPLWCAPALVFALSVGIFYGRSPWYQLVSLGKFWSIAALSGLLAAMALLTYILRRFYRNKADEQGARAALARISAVYFIFIFLAFGARTIIFHGGWADLWRISDTTPEWEDLCRWVQTHTPKQPLGFVIDPNLEPAVTFRFLAKREPLYDTFNTWAEGFYPDRKQKNKTVRDALSGYDDFRAEDFVRLRRRFNAPFFLTKSDHAIAAQDPQVHKIYSNNSYALWRVIGH